MNQYAIVYNFSVQEDIAGNKKVCGGGVVVCGWMGKPKLETKRSRDRPKSFLEIS